jgi:hypothetical protein
MFLLFANLADFARVQAYEQKLAGPMEGTAIADTRNSSMRVAIQAD